jgi:hypothetical protein
MARKIEIRKKTEVYWEFGPVNSTIQMIWKNGTQIKSAIWTVRIVNKVISKA